MAAPNVEFPLRRVDDDDQQPRSATAAGAAAAWLWGRTLLPTTTASSPREPEDDESWEVRAFAEDSRSVTGGTWPPRSYSCTFCRREFRSAQALGGHMNVHRRDRARLRECERFHSQSSICGTDYPPGVCVLYPLPPPFPSSVVGIDACIASSLINPSSLSPTNPSAVVSQNQSSSPRKTPYSAFAPPSLMAAASSLHSPIACSSAFKSVPPLSPSLLPSHSSLISSTRSNHSFFSIDYSDRNRCPDPSTCFPTHYRNDDSPRESKQMEPFTPYQGISLEEHDRCSQTIDFDQPEAQNDNVPLGLDLELRLGY